MPQTAEMQAHGVVPSYYDDLAASFDHAWLLISRGVRDRRSPFHTPTLATVDADGAPEARTIVLRSAARDTATLRFHTDRRSDKPSQLLQDPRCSVHVYDPASKIQIRLRGNATLHAEDVVADMAWSGSLPRSRLCYSQADKPGAPLESPDALATIDADAGRANFAVIQISISEVEWLYLSHLGHRRALWVRDGAGWQGRWLAP